MPYRLQNRWGLLCLTNKKTKDYENDERTKNSMRIE